MGVVSSRRGESGFVRIHQGLRRCTRWRLWYVLPSLSLSTGADSVTVESKTAEGIALAVKLLDDLAASHPRSLAIRRLALDIASGEEFRSRASKFLTNALSKGIPVIFADMKALYSDLEKRTIIGELAEGYRKSLETDGKFSGAVEGDSEGEILSLHRLDIFSMLPSRFRRSLVSIPVDALLSRSAPLLFRRLFSARRSRHSRSCRSTHPVAS